MQNTTYKMAGSEVAVCFGTEKCTTKCEIKYTCLQAIVCDQGYSNQDFCKYRK